MRLKCYAVSPDPPKLVPARPDRAWMDAFPSRHAYRCLPLSIANTHGWELLSPTTFSIHFNGGSEAADICFDAHDGFANLNHFVVSNFSRGVVTFHTGYIFQTDPGWNLLATGSFNQPKDGISPLTGLVETSWLPYPFTMNWQLTRPGVVRFEKDEPFCLVFPVAQNALETTQPEILSLESDPAFAAQYSVWREKREQFMAKFRAGDAATLREAWQKFYFKGELPTAEAPIADHVQKLRLATPADLRTQSPATSPSHFVITAEMKRPRGEPQ
jgi:hypothetical protein